MGRVIRLSHLLFFDGVFILCAWLGEEGKILKDILELFCNAIGMVVNEQKSAIYFPRFVEEGWQILEGYLNFPSFKLDEG